MYKSSPKSSSPKSSSPKNSSRESSSPENSSPETPRTKGQETRERIFQRALEYFNENGIEYVGIRELARELGLSPGNVSYYFPTKEDLVIEISKRLSTGNTQLFHQVTEDVSIQSFMQLFLTAFTNLWNYRCLFTSFVHIMKHYPSLGERYRELQQKRRADLAHDLEELSRLGYLKRSLTKEEIGQLVMTIAYQARFWVQEAEVLMHDVPREKVVAHHVGLIAGLLLPYSTAKGRQHLEVYSKGILRKF
ncbi:MAG TPA: TetR/AcrR family transcriptional regulator [Candidatus Kapabacteria bacterium]|nr:TetR/AcrR family transcriptional regulator [Candidatus Kapabacteria bacterium]